MFRRPRILYTTVFCWITFVNGRFLAPFLEHAGLTATHIGIALSLQQGISTLGGAVGGAIADAWEQQCPGGRARVMAIGTVCGTVVFLLHGVSTVVPTGSKLLPMVSSPVYHIVLRGCFAICNSLVFPVLDGLTIDFLKASKQDYGKERLFGAIAWAVANVLLAPLLDALGFVVLYPMAILTSFLLLVSLYGHVRSSEKQLDKRNSTIATLHEEEPDHERAASTAESSETPARISFWGLLSLLVPSGAAAGFLFCLFCLSQGQALVDNLIFLFFEVLGSSYSLMGWTVVLTVLFEIPIFHIAPVLLQRFGATALLLLAGCCYFVRVVLYTLIPPGHASYVFYLEPMHGITFACTQTAMVDFVADIMPHGYEASGQGLVNVFKGCGAMAGLAVGGWAEDSVGPRILYRLSAAVVVLGCAVMVATRRTCGHDYVQLAKDIELGRRSQDTSLNHGVDFDNKQIFRFHDT